MAEFKLSPGFSSAVESTRSAGAQLDAGSVSLASSSLPTVQKIAEQHREISALMRIYGELVQKDMGDLETVVVRVHEMDESMAL